MYKKYSVYIPWIIGFTILFILSILNGQWPPVRPTENSFRDGTPTTPGPISTTTTPPTDVTVVVTPTTPGPISTTTTPPSNVTVVVTPTTPGPISTTTTPATIGSVTPIAITPEPDPISTTPSPAFLGGTLEPEDIPAIRTAESVAPEFEEAYGIKFSPTKAQGQSAAPAGGSPSNIVGVVVPVSYGNQKYHDQSGRELDVLGILSIEPPLYVEIQITVEEAPIQYSRLQTGSYLVACTPATMQAANQTRDCIAVSEEGVEFIIRQDSIDLKDLQNQEAITAPTAEFISGSVHACFTIRRRRICVRAF